MKRAILVAVLGLAVACAPTGNPPISRAKGAPHCVQVVVDTLSTNDSAGLWNCLSPDSRAYYFYASGWHDDASVAATLGGSDAGLDVLLYDHNPVSGNQWLLYASPVDDNGHPQLTRGQGLKITLDQSGHITKIE